MIIHLLVLVLVFGVIAAIIQLLPIDEQWKRIAYMLLALIVVITLVGDFLWWPSYRVSP